MTGAQSRTIARLRKKHPGLEWSTTDGVRVRYTERGADSPTTKIVSPSGLLEDPPVVVNLDDRPHLRDVAKPDAALETLTYGQQEALRIALRQQTHEAEIHGWIRHVNDDSYSTKQIFDIADGHKQLVAALERVAGGG